MTNGEITDKMREIDRKIKNMKQILTNQLKETVGEHYSSKDTHRIYLRKIEAMDAILEI